MPVRATWIDQSGKVRGEWTTQDDGSHRPTVVCLCGSTRFKADFIVANFRETMRGKIVLTVGWFSHADAEAYTPTPAEKAALDELHKRKIDLSDEVLVINRDGYIGESTRSEIEYAKSRRIPIRYMWPQEATPDPDPPGGGS